MSTPMCEALGSPTPASCEVSNSTAKMELPAAPSLVAVVRPRALPAAATSAEVPLAFRTSLGGSVVLSMDASPKRTILRTTGSAELKLAQFHFASCPSAGVVATLNKRITMSGTLHPHGFDMFRPCECARGTDQIISVSNVRCRRFLRDEFCNHIPQHEKFHSNASISIRGEV